MSEINEFISLKVVDLISRRLGDAAKYVTVYVSFSDKGVEVEVNVDASVLVDEEYLKKVVDEAADFGVCLADVIKEKGWPLDNKHIEKCWKS
ncbi:MAG: hypothetical protein QW680_00605 [Pyrobaculum sp.]